MNLVRSQIQLEVLYSDIGENQTICAKDYIYLYSFTTACDVLYMRFVCFRFKCVVTLAALCFYACFASCCLALWEIFLAFQSDG